MPNILEDLLLVIRSEVDGSGFQKLNNQVKTAHSSMFSLKNLLAGFIGFDLYQGLKQLPMTLIETSKELGAMESRFYAITKSEQMANRELEWAFNLAKRTAMPMKSVADSFSIFYSATAKSLGQDSAEQVFQDWTEVSRVLHLSEYQFERVTYALREMASKGAIYSQDLRMQIGTHVPNAMGLAEKAVADLGITGNEWFETFQNQAKGNQKLINQFIVLFSKYAKESYASNEALAKSMELPDAQLGKLANNFYELRKAIVQSGFQKDLVSFLKIVNQGLEGLTSNADMLYGILKGILVTMVAIEALSIVGWFIKGGKIGIPKVLLGIGAWLGNAVIGVKAIFDAVKVGFTSSILKSVFSFVMKLLPAGLSKIGATIGLIGFQFIPIVGQVADLLLLIWSIWSALRLAGNYFRPIYDWVAKITNAWERFWNMATFGLYDPYKKYNTSQPTVTPTDMKLPNMNVQSRGLGGPRVTNNVSPTISISNNISVDGSMSTDEIQKVIDNSNNNAVDKINQNLNRGIGYTAQGNLSTLLPLRSRF